MGKKFVGLDGLKHFWTKAKTWIAGQITAEVTAKIAEIVANAPEDLDTLKEIADWISAHANDASAMNTAILANTEAISGKADKSHTHTKSEITDFPTSLPATVDTTDTVTSGSTTPITSGGVYAALKGFIKTKNIKVGDITMPVTNYFKVSTDLTSSDTIISAKLSTWSSNTDCFSIICYKKNYVYIVAKSDTAIKNVTVTVFYI